MVHPLRLRGRLGPDLRRRFETEDVLQSSLGVALEAVASRVMTLRVVREVKRIDENEVLSYRRIVDFYTPLALTSIISLAVHPMVAFFMGHSRFALESLAVLPVVNSLSFIL